MNGVIIKTIASDHRGKYGFIKDEDGQDRYFSSKELVGVAFENLHIGDQVSFDPAVGGRNNAGLRAAGVHKADGV